MVLDGYRKGKVQMEGSRGLEDERCDQEVIQGTFDSSRIPYNIPVKKSEDYQFRGQEIDVACSSP
jgi:hypothetical protein